MSVCVCCSNYIGVDGPDVVVKSGAAFVEMIGADDDKLTGKVGRGRVEIRVTLTRESADELIEQINSAMTRQWRAGC